MLSDCLREMRREFQTALLEADASVQISALKMQSYALALAMYEDAALDMEQRLKDQPALTQPSGSVVIPFPIHQKKHPHLFVIQTDGNDIA